MKYTYAYKTSDGRRHEASMDAECREDVFATLRTQGIRAIKVVACDGSKANGEVRGVRRRVVAAWVCVAAIAAGVAVYALVRVGDAASVRNPIPATRGDAPKMLRTASPLPRQVIPGDRRRIAEAAKSLPFAAERLLAAFAEPGRVVAPRRAERPSDAEFEASLREPLRIGADEFTESVDLKRIVTRIKADLRGYLSDGGTVDDYLAELMKRQRLEISYREKAEMRLAEHLAAKDVQLAYDFWLKANAQLQSMGIYALPLPDALREYQLSQGLEE